MNEIDLLVKQTLNDLGVVEKKEPFIKKFNFLFRLPNFVSALVPKQNNNYYYGTSYEEDLAQPTYVIRGVKKKYLRQFAKSS